MDPIVRIREGEIMRLRWRQCEVISHNSVIIIDMVEAIVAGWNFGRVTEQGDESWCGMSAAGIVAFKRNDKCARLATDDEASGILSWLARRSAERAA